MKHQMPRRQFYKKMVEFSKELEKHDNIHNTIRIDKNGRITNWKELNIPTKEDYIEDTYEDINYYKLWDVEGHKWPGVKLLKKLGWSKLYDYNEKCKNERD